jgi:hypothetical protein
MTDQNRDLDSTYQPCIGGHTVFWAGSGWAPEGTRCSCGRTVVTYETCPTCGDRRIVMKEAKDD